MKQTFTLLFFIIINSAFSQIEYSRFSIKPQISFGVALPGAQKRISGTETLTYAWRTNAIGQTSDAQGNSAISFRTTNRLGIHLNYRVSEALNVGLGVNRTNLVISYNSSFRYTLNNGTISQSFIENLPFYDFSAQFNYSFGNKFIVFQPSYIPNIFSINSRNGNSISLGNNINDFRNNSGTGVEFINYDLNDKKYNIYLGYGQKATFLALDIEWQLGINFRPGYVYKEKAKFYNRGSQIGEIDTKINSSGLFLTINTPIRFKTSKTKSLPAQNSKELENSINETSDQNTKVEIGNKTVRKGENLILDNIQFEQTKATLNSAAMSDLDQVYNFLMKYPKSIIEITGHTSNEGNRSDNLELSRKRAEECKAYLLRKGIKSSRIKAFGLGPNRPISVLDQNLNRRVEMKIISFE